MQQYSRHGTVAVPDIHHAEGFDDEDNTKVDDSGRLTMGSLFLNHENIDVGTHGYVTRDSPNGMERSLTTPGNLRPSSFERNISGNISSLNEAFRSTVCKSVPHYTIEPPSYTSYNGHGFSAREAYDSLRDILNASGENIKGVSSKICDISVSFLYFGRSVLLNALGIACGVLLTVFFLSILGRIFTYRSHDFNEIAPKNRRIDKNHENKERPREKHVQPVKPRVVLEPVYFKDVLGIDDAKEELLEVVKFIKHPKLYENVGAKIPKGILLIGSPGTGKTMLAKAVATEANIPFIYTSGPEFVEIFVGQGAQRVRSLFEKARRTAPCIIFIDEIDAIGSRRASGSFSGQNREHDQTLNQLLVEMDGFNLSTGITLLAATNRVETLDRALLRPGRFDRVVYIPLPTVDGREAILRRYMDNVKYDKENINIRDMAKLTPGYSGADLKNLVNEAALNCVKHGRSRVTFDDMQEARDKVGMGSIRRTTQPEIQRKMTAYHEAGHALVAYHLYPNTDPIHKATIVSRGSALGFVEQLPDGDRLSYKLAEMKARLAVCMGGRIAEELVFGKDNVTSGASSDIYAATELAYRMVTEWGMSRRLGPVNYKRIGGITNFHGIRSLSPETAKIVEQEVKLLVKEAHNLAEGIIRQYRDQLEKIASQLLERETLTGEEIKALLECRGKSQ